MHSRSSWSKLYWEYYPFLNVDLYHYNDRFIKWQTFQTNKQTYQVEQRINNKHS